VRFYLKQIGCELAEHGVRVPKSFVSFLNGRGVPFGLALWLSFRLDVIAMEQHSLDVHNEPVGVVWRRFNLTYTRRAGPKIAWGYTGIGALRASYTVKIGGWRYRSTLRRDKVLIPKEFDLSPDKVSEMCGGCNPE
jgi:hypothetical protein